MNSYLQPQHGQQISGAELIIHGLEQHGVRIVSGVPGGALLPLYEALGRSRLIRHILARHEQAAGFIAQGMARVTGRAGVCLATSGPGVTNIVTALADAKLDSVPLVCIAGQVPQHLIGTDAFQEVATLEMVRPITKACFFVKSAHEVADILTRAFHIAEHGRPGPVLIDVPKDVQMQLIALKHSHPIWQHHASPASECSPVMNASAFDQAAELIAAANRPLFYLGGGVVKARSQSVARELVEYSGIPVTTTLMALGLLPHDHELNLGMLGMHGARYTNHTIEAADLLIAIGARFDDRATGNPQHFATQAKIIHIDIDPRELGKIKQPDLAIHADAATALHELFKRADAFSSAHPARKPWHTYIRGLRTSYPLLKPREEELCSPYGIMRSLGECLSPDTIVTTDVGQHQMWTAQALPLHHADRWLTSGGLGTMGFGLPAAIGAALASPDSPVVCISGDGSLLMNIQEFATLAELKLNVKIILLDNAALGLVRQQQELFYQQRYTASRFHQATDFVGIARAFGLHAHDLDKAHAPRELLQQALTTPGPMLVRVPIDEAEHVLPMVAPGKPNTQPVEHSMGASTVTLCANA